MHQSINYINRKEKSVECYNFLSNFLGIYFLELEFNFLAISKLMEVKIISSRISITYPDNGIAKFAQSG